MPIKVGDFTAYNVEELSELLGVQPKTIREMLKTGKLHGKKLARRWYVSEEDIRAYFQEPEGGLR